MFLFVYKITHHPSFPEPFFYTTFSFLGFQTCRTNFNPCNKWELESSYNVVRKLKDCSINEIHDPDMVIIRLKYIFLELPWMAYSSIHVDPTMATLSTRVRTRK